MMAGSVSTKLKDKLTKIKDHLFGYIQTGNIAPFAGNLGSEHNGGGSSDKEYISILKFFTWYLLGLQDGANKSREVYSKVFNSYFKEDALTFEDML